MKKRVAIVNALLLAIICAACSPKTNDSTTLVIAETKQTKEAEWLNEPLVGTWIIDIDGEVMLDPQTSGLKYADGYLYTLSDASADESQLLRLHQVSLESSQIIKKFGPTEYNQTVQDSCFFNYLSNRPDYEGLVPISAGVWVFVTEDASRSEPLSAACQETYAETGSTVFPTLVVRLVLEGDQLIITHVRPIQFAQDAQVGDFPNDGIEGLTITKDKRLLLGLEKDANAQARVFELPLTEDFWSKQGFAQASDSQLLLPTFTSGNHPINGMDVYYPNSSSQGYLIAAARNDDELWVIDLAKKKQTTRIKLSFLAPSDTSMNNNDTMCEDTHLMDNASIEGVAVAGDKIWLVNDPWKRNYMKNVVCAADEARYKRRAPLIFNIDINDAWFY